MLTHARTPVFLSSRSIDYAGAELDDDTVPSPNHDIFILTRPAARAQATITFRQPGRPNFELELPLSSSLAGVKAALVSASTSRPNELNVDQCCRPTPAAAATPAAAGDGRDLDDCTLIIRGKTMSNACLLGDYLSAAEVVAPTSGRRHHLRCREVVAQEARVRHRLTTDD